MTGWQLRFDSGCLLALVLLPACSEQAVAQQETTSVASGKEDTRTNTYEVDVTPARLIPRELPAAPYKNSYEFTPEHEWFKHHIAVWDAILDEFKDSPGINYLEVGCYEGGSAVWMLENVLTHEESTLTCIDPFLPWFGGEVSKKRFLSNVKLAGGADRTNLIIGYSQVELRKLPLESFDIVYIDGDHSAIAVLEDAVLSWPLLKPGGLVIFDDYAWQHSREPPLRPLMALDFFTEIYGPQAEIVHRDYQLILRKRR